MLSELPADPVKRDAVLDASAATAGPEQRKGMTTKERKAETAAATAAAILGSMFSSTQSVTIGTASPLDENQLVAPQPAQPARPRASAGPEKDAAKPDPAPTDDPGASNADLVPWIKLK
ncbi:MAG TPA: hypothetical protein VFK02_27995 [Kofleriaceae bacterium]|nr:hypothetical protein [Kofleriaceae bacterium]